MASDPVRSTSTSQNGSRSPWIFGRGDSVLLVVDMQEKLVPLVHDAAHVTWNIHRLVEAAQLLEVPILATEQYPKGLGPTVSGLRERLGTLPEKLSFSCVGCQPFYESLQQTGRTKIVVVGIETHICVMQTTLELIAAGFDVQVVVDGVASRRTIDHATAIDRMKLCGAFPSTVEATLFEWLRTAEAKEFKAISAIVRQAPPEA